MNNVDRRTFLKTTGVGLAASTLPSWNTAHAADADARPNFLFVLTDDQRWDALGVVQREQGDAARFPWFRTPHLDRLAEAGIRFRNAFVVNSLCAPSRATFMTGQYGHRNGIVNNHTPFPAESVTYASMLRAAGYRNDYNGAMARSVPNLATPAIYRAKGTPRPTEIPREVKVNPGYFACLTAMDENVGRLLKALDDLGLAENTVVVFAGDNGYYFGEHCLGDKRSAYEESLRIPLLLRYPKLAPKGRLVDEMVLNTDLASTILDLAGVPLPQTLQGCSWRPLLTGAAGAWREAYFYCYFFERGFEAIPTVTAVRTAEAKLIRYPGHDEWTEVFDLAADPYETRNLALDPAAVSLRRSLELEYERQATAVGFGIPAFADQPGQSASGAKPLNAWVLEYRFDRDDRDRVVDASGRGNHGQAQGCPLGDGRDGRRARRFDGKGLIEVPKSASLDPSGGPWTVEVVFKAEGPAGVILARGGRTEGYCLHLRAGRPVFTVTGSNTASSVTAQEVVTGAWTTAQARITAAGELLLSLDGAPSARSRLDSPIAADPNDTMQIGADRNSPVAGDESATGFSGLIESVRLFNGEN